VSNTEFYSVPRNEPQGLAYTELPQRVWVNREACVWHCQQTPLNVQNEAPVRRKDLLSFHEDLSSKFEALSRRSDQYADWSDLKVPSPAAASGALLEEVKEWVFKFCERAFGIGRRNEKRTLKELNFGNEKQLIMLASAFDTEAHKPEWFYANVQPGELITKAQIKDTTFGQLIAIFPNAVKKAASA
jgi:hypothetical protein